MIRSLPDQVKISGAVRWGTHIEDKQYTQWIRELMETCQSVGAVGHVLDVKKPFKTDIHGEFARLCLEEASTLVAGVSFKTQPVTNEANVFSRFGFECIVFGPGHRQNNAHTPEEHVSLADLKKAEDVYFKIMNRVCI